MPSMWCARAILPQRAVIPNHDPLAFWTALITSVFRLPELKTDNPKTLNLISVGISVVLVYALVTF
jgi:hypothetical protein